MRTYSQIKGDGGSGVAGQIAELEAQIAGRMASIRHVVAIGSGKGGVGKSTLTRHLAAVLAQAGQKVGIFDADMNGPSQAMLGGVSDVPPLPGEDGLVLPRTREGVQILSMGSVLAEAKALSWPSVVGGSSHTWRATREAASLHELLATVAWGTLDILLVDMPPGPERTAQLAAIFGPQTAIVLVSIPSALAHGVVARSLDALKPHPNRVLGYIENMSGYACPGCNVVRPLFPEDTDALDLGLDCLGRVPFDPALAALCDRGIAVTEPGGALAASPVATALAGVASALLNRL